MPLLTYTYCYIAAKRILNSLAAPLSRLIFRPFS